jgi:hypothetical protein
MTAAILDSSLVEQAAARLSHLDRFESGSMRERSLALVVTLTLALLSTLISTGAALAATVRVMETTITEGSGTFIARMVLYEAAKGETERGDDLACRRPNRDRRPGSDDLRWAPVAPPSVRARPPVAPLASMLFAFSRATSTTSSSRRTSVRRRSTLVRA